MIGSRLYDGYEGAVTLFKRESEVSFFAVNDWQRKGETHGETREEPSSEQDQGRLERLQNETDDERDELFTRVDSLRSLRRRVRGVGRGD